MERTTRYDEERTEMRAARRASAERYAAALLTWEEILGWAKTWCPKAVRQGFVRFDLLVTQEAFDDLPGDDIKQSTNALGETIYRKRCQIPGSPAAEIKLSCIVRDGGDS